MLVLICADERGLRQLYLVFGSDHAWFKTLFYDIKDDKRIMISNADLSPWLNNNKLLAFLCRVCFSKKISRMIKIPMKIQRLWYNRIAMGGGKNNGEKLFLIFNSMNRFGNNIDFLNYLKKKDSIVLVRWYTDLIETCGLNHEDSIIQELSICKYYDFVVTYDPNEAKRYNFNYVETPYSALPKSKIIMQPETFDVLYIGAAKLENGDERYNTIIEAYEYFVRAGLKVKFYITEVPEEKQVYANSIIYNQYVEYEKNIGLVLGTKAILEVSQRKETGTTLRMFEAIKYDKLFLFNNKNLISHNLYDSNYMFYYDKPTDLCITDVFAEKEVNYKNKDEIHPIKFFENIKSISEVLS